MCMRACVCVVNMYISILYYTFIYFTADRVVRITLFTPCVSVSAPPEISWYVRTLYERMYTRTATDIVVCVCVCVRFMFIIPFCCVIDPYSRSIPIPLVSYYYRHWRP